MFSVATIISLTVCAKSAFFHILKQSNFGVRLSESHQGRNNKLGNIKLSVKT